MLEHIRELALQDNPSAWNPKMRSPHQGEWEKNMVPPVAEQGRKMRFPFKWVGKKKSIRVHFLESRESCTHREVPTHFQALFSRCSTETPKKYWRQGRKIPSGGEDKLPVLEDREPCSCIRPFFQKAQTSGRGTVITVTFSRTDPVSWKDRRKYLYPWGCTGQEIVLSQDSSGPTLQGSCHSARVRKPAQPLPQIQEENWLLALRRKITEKTPL